MEVNVINELKIAIEALKRDILNKQEVLNKLIDEYQELSGNVVEE